MNTMMLRKMTLKIELKEDWLDYFNLQDYEELIDDLVMESVQYSEVDHGRYREPGR